MEDEGRREEGGGRRKEGGGREEATEVVCHLGWTI
jgi:hypothetical protein